jgi:hypothetical protein
VKTPFIFVVDSVVNSKSTEAWMMMMDYGVEKWRQRQPGKWC